MNHAPSGFLVGASCRKLLLEKASLERLISRLASQQEARYAARSDSACVLCHCCSRLWRLHFSSAAQGDSHLADGLPTCIISERISASTSRTVWQRHRWMRQCRLMGTYRSSLNKLAWQTAGSTVLMLRYVTWQVLSLNRRRFKLTTTSELSERPAFSTDTWQTSSSMEAMTRSKMLPARWVG